MKIFDVILKDFEEIVVLILSDVHIGDMLCDTRRLREFVAEVESKPNVFVIINGDLLDNATIDSKGDSYKQKLTPNEQINKAVEILRPIKDHILVATEGNHEARTSKKAGINLIERVIKELGLTKEAGYERDVYSEGAYLLFVSFGKNRGRDTRQTVYAIYGKHGHGGGKRAGSKANALEDMLNTINADIFLHSHTHLPMSFRLCSYTVDYRNRLAHSKEHLFVNSSAFLKYGGYGEALGYRPATTIYPKLILNGKKRNARAVI